MFRRALALVLVSTCAFAGLAAAQAPSPEVPSVGGMSPGMPPNMPPEQMERFQLSQKLQALQQRALEDPAIAKKQRATLDRVEAAIIAHDKSLEPAVKRVREIEMEMKAAQKAADVAKAQTLMQEVGTLMQKLMPAQQAVMGNPELVAAMKSFEKEVEAKMNELDPTANEMIMKLQAMARPQMRLPGPKPSAPPVPPLPPPGK